jgi:hypothetical protein
MAQGRHAWPALGRRPVQGRAGDVASGLSDCRGVNKRAREEVTRRAGARPRARPGAGGRAAWALAHADAALRTPRVGAMAVAAVSRPVITAGRASRRAGAAHGGGCASPRDRPPLHLQSRRPVEEPSCRVVIRSRSNPYIGISGDTTHEWRLMTLPSDCCHGVGPAGSRHRMRALVMTPI